MTINNIKATYGDRYTYTAVDKAGFYWEEFMGNWSAIGEFGWNASDADIDNAGIKKISVDEADRIVYIYVNGEL